MIQSLLLVSCRAHQHRRWQRCEGAATDKLQRGETTAVTQLQIGNLFRDRLGEAIRGLT